MDSFGCTDSSIPQALRGVITADSRGLADASRLMFRDGSTYWLDDTDFSSYFRGQMQSFLDHAKIPSPAGKIGFLWQGKQRVMGNFTCYAKEWCKVKLERTPKGWVSTQFTSPCPSRLSYQPKVYKPSAARKEEGLSFNYSFYGPAEALVYFNEARVWMHYGSIISNPRLAPDFFHSKSCRFDKSGIPDGLFKVEVHPLPNFIP
ncbi:hypothetical protein DSO57_1034174 [Entomophthora muscae]|uniref:Uncharacterized protein n=1 Tax=Entomophthora muscae TaxID=34485 RepID=A0ACC2SCU0_9FUNG|nr:hypothetical protein DSO57_1034174 [Entomophthora muscae]